MSIYIMIEFELAIKGIHTNHRNCIKIKFVHELKWVSIDKTKWVQIEQTKWVIINKTYLKLNKKEDNSSLTIICKTNRS